MEMPQGNAGVVDKLTTLLEQAKRGDITSFAAVTYKRSGGADQSGVVRREDTEQVVGALGELAQSLTQMQEQMSAG